MIMMERRSDTELYWYRLDCVDLDLRKRYRLSPDWMKNSEKYLSNIFFLGLFQGVEVSR